MIPNRIPMEEDESMMSQSNNGSVTPMAYSNRQSSVINSQASNTGGGGLTSNLLNKFAFNGEAKSSAYKVRVPGEKPPSLDNYFTKTKSSPMRESLSKEKPKPI